MVEALEVESTVKSEAPSSPEAQRPLKAAAGVELLALALAAMVVVSTFVWASREFRETVLLAACFASLNFRLLVWSWAGVLGWKQRRVSRIGMVGRFVLKLVVFFGGLLVLLLAKNRPPLAVLVGFVPLLVGMVCSPFFLKSE